jgi:hypothetical protein
VLAQDRASQARLDRPHGADNNAQPQERQTPMLGQICKWSTGPLCKGKAVLMAPESKSAHRLGASA